MVLIHKIDVQGKHDIFILYISIIGFAIPAIILLIEIIIKLRDNNYHINRQIYIALTLCALFVLGFLINLTLVY